MFTLSRELKQCILDGTGREPDGPLDKDRARFDEIRLHLGERRPWLPNTPTRVSFLWKGAEVGFMTAPALAPGDTLTLADMECWFKLLIE